MIEKLLLIVVGADRMIEIGLAVDQFGNSITLSGVSHRIATLAGDIVGFGILALAGHVDAVACIRLVDDVAIGGPVRSTVSASET